MSYYPKRNHKKPLPSSTDDDGLSHLPTVDLRIICWPYTAVKPKSESEKASDRKHQRIIRFTALAICGLSLCFQYLPGIFIGALLFWVQTETDRFGTNKPAGINPHLMCWLWLIWAVLFQFFTSRQDTIDWFGTAIFAPAFLPMLVMWTHRSLYAIGLRPNKIFLSKATGVKADDEPEGLDFAYIDSITLSENRKYIHLKKNQRWATYKSNTGESKADRIPIKAIPDRNSWNQIEEYIKKNAPSIVIDPQIAQQFQTHVRETASTFTQLWLESMESPGTRLSMKPLQSGSTIKNGSITISAQLSSGGQSCVYEAIVGGKKVILKEYTLPSSMDLAARKASVVAFSEEAMLLENMEHSGIVKVHDHFIEDHRGYMVFDLLEGASLKAVVRDNGPLSEESVRSLLPQLIDILVYLSTRTPPVVHRDFTPDNLILSHDGRVTLIDFTIATPVSESSQDPAGKQAYMSIEQFRGKPELASDLYSLGATLHFLLTGEDPQPISVSHPKTINEHVSADLDELVAELTTAKASQRPSLGTLTTKFPNDSVQTSLRTRNAEAIQP